jgi:tetratricopeptide (TPR) repeat protein
MKRFLALPLLTICFFTLAAFAQDNTLQVNAPVAHRTAQPPDPNASATQLEAQGDTLRAEKGYLDAMDFYHAALKKASTQAAKSQIWNKIGITELQTGHFPEAKKGFEHAIKADSQFAEPHNNLGVVYYEVKKYDKAIKNYEKAITLKEASASFHSNLGTAYFAKQEFDRATVEYGRALQLDPTIFQHKSQIGIAAQMSSPEDRAHYFYVLAGMYAKAGMLDQAFLYLRHAMEDGYKNIDDVYKDNEFAGLRNDPRFNDLMAQRPPTIPQ